MARVKRGRRQAGEKTHTTSLSLDFLSRRQQTVPSATEPGFSQLNLTRDAPESFMSVGEFSSICLFLSPYPSLALPPPALLTLRSCTTLCLSAAAFGSGINNFRGTLGLRVIRGGGRGGWDPKASHRSSRPPSHPGLADPFQAAVTSRGA